MWQPIETAPKNGTLVDLWFPGIGRKTDWEWWGDDLHEPGWCHRPKNGGYAYHPNTSPTHWMLPPKPPVTP